MDDVTLDRALIFSILQADKPGFFKARDAGLQSEHVQDEDQKIFTLMETFVRRHNRLPTTTEIKADSGVDIIIPEMPYEVELFAEKIAERALQNKLQDGLGPITREVLTDPKAARVNLAELVKTTAWSLGSVASYTDPVIADTIFGDYERAKSKGSGLLGYPSPWPNVDKHSLGLQPGELTVLLAKRKTGKCLAAGTLISDPRTGLQVPVERFVADGACDVLTWGQNQPIHSVKPDAYIDTGTKECFRITWRSGRTLVVTPEHPLMTPTGWKRLDQLQEGHHTAAVAILPEPTQTLRMTSGMPEFLAYMIAEGGCSKPSTPTFTSSVPELVEDMRECLKPLDCVLKPAKDDPGNYYVVMNNTGNSVVGNRAVRVLELHGVIGKKSIEKTIPDAVFSASNEQLALFLGRLWSCDGTVEKSGQVSYSTGSRELADQVQHLLLRFGVTSRIRILTRSIKDGERDYYEIVVHRERIERFKSQIGPHFIGPKSERLQAVTFQGRSRVGWLRNEELRGQIVAEIDADRSLLQDVGEELGYSFRFQKGHIFDSKSGRIRKKVFGAFCDVYGSPLRWVLDENIQWDEIVMVEPVGEKRVFDLTVLPTRCFVANDVIVHNTWMLLTWFVHILRTALKPGENLLIASMEMPDVQMYRRMAAIDLHLCYKDFRAGTLTSEEERRLKDWVEAMRDGDESRPTIHVAGANVIRSVGDICDKVAELNSKVVGIDGFYILGRDSKKAMWERTIDNVQGIKLDLCAGMNIGCLATTQFAGKKAKNDLNADADDAAYAKAIGDWADAMRGVFMNDAYEKNKRRVFRAMESREFQGVDLVIHFDLDRMNFAEERILEGDAEKSPIAEEAKKTAGGDDEPAILSGTVDEEADEEPGSLTGETEIEY